MGRLPQLAFLVILIIVFGAFYEVRVRKLYQDPLVESKAPEVKIGPDAVRIPFGSNNWKPGVIEDLASQGQGFRGTKLRYTAGGVFADKTGQYVDVFAFDIGTKDRQSAIDFNRSSIKGVVDSESADCYAFVDLAPERPGQDVVVYPEKCREKPGHTDMIRYGVGAGGPYWVVYHRDYISYPDLLNWIEILSKTTIPQ